MKLIYCPDCEDVLRLISEKIRYCKCKKSFGKYKKDGINAIIGGLAIPIGFANSSFVNALHHRPLYGLGERFEAFIIPYRCETIIIKEKE